MVTNYSLVLTLIELDSGQIIQRSVHTCEEHVFVDSAGTTFVKLTHNGFCFFIDIFALVVEVIGGTKEPSHVVLARVAFLLAV